eukprot:gene3274-13298_t
MAGHDLARLDLARLDLALLDLVPGRPGAARPGRQQPAQLATRGRSVPTETEAAIRWRQNHILRRRDSVRVGVDDAIPRDSNVVGDTRQRQTTLELHSSGVGGATPAPGVGGQRQRQRQRQRHAQSGIAIGAPGADNPSSDSDEGESGVTQSSLPPYEADSLRTPSKTPTPPPPTPGTQSSQSASRKAAKSTASLPPPPVTPAVPSPLAPRQVGDFGLSKKITELRKELRSFPPDEKLGDLDGSSKLRRWRVAVETVLSVQFGQSYGD